MEACDVALSMNKTSSCVIQEIHGISNYNHDPASCMEAFCLLNLAGKPKYGSMPARADSLYSVYYFCASVPTGKTISYGSQLADYIKEHKLGTVVGTEPVLNEAFHPDRCGQAWLWVPDRLAIRAWYDALLATRPKVVRKPKPVMSPKPQIGMYGDYDLAKAAVVAKNPHTKGKWDVALGVAGGPCATCARPFVLYEPIYSQNGNYHYVCEPCGMKIETAPEPAVEVAPF